MIVRIDDNCKTILFIDNYINVNDLIIYLNNFLDKNIIDKEYTLITKNSSEFIPDYIKKMTTKESLKYFIPNITDSEINSILKDSSNK